MKFALVAFMLALPSAAFAQQQQISPSQAALQIGNIVSQLAQGAEQSIVLQGQLAQAQAKIKQLEEEKKAKEAEPKKTP